MGILLQIVPVQDPDLKETRQGKTTGVNPAVALEKALEKEKLGDLTRTYISKRGEASEKGWYASHDGKSTSERKGGVEKSLDRA